MKNKLTDLNDHLFAQLERLGNESLSKEDLSKEVERSRAITDVSKQVVGNARLVLDAEKFMADGASMVRRKNMPAMLGSKELGSSNNEQ